MKNMFWKKKKPQNDEDLDFFIKIGLTKSEKLNIYIGWPSANPDDDTIRKLTILINGIFNSLFSSTIEKELRDFHNPLIDKALDNIPRINNKYVSPLDVI